MRKRCRNCDASLIMHPDAAIDREVRLDFSEGVQLEESVQNDQ